jgi:hypothetical protein
VSPYKDLNSKGGDQLTISGEYLPTSLDDGSTISVTFSDGTNCNLLSSTETEIVCITDAFAANSNTVTMIVTVNDVSDDSLTVSIAKAPGNIVSISPSIASPV